MTATQRQRLARNSQLKETLKKMRKKEKKTHQTTANRKQQAKQPTGDTQGWLKRFQFTSRLSPTLSAKAEPVKTAANTPGTNKHHNPHHHHRDECTISTDHDCKVAKQTV